MPWPMPKPDYMDVLRTGQWFQTLPADVQQQVVDAGTVRTLRQSQVLFRQGDDPSGLHAVVKGKLHITGVGLNGNDVIMAIVRLGDWTGFLACLDRRTLAGWRNRCGLRKILFAPGAQVRSRT